MRNKRRERKKKKRAELARYAVADRASETRRFLAPGKLNRQPPPSKGLRPPPFPPPSSLLSALGRADADFSPFSGIIHFRLAAFQSGRDKWRSTARWILPTNLPVASPSPLPLPPRSPPSGPLIRFIRAISGRSATGVHRSPVAESFLRSSVDFYVDFKRAHPRSRCATGAALRG